MAKTNPSIDASDIVQDSPVLRALPEPLRPYARLARLDRAIGTWLLLLPCWWGLSLAWIGHPALPLPSPWYFLLFGIGALVMRGAGCTWNDITDRDYDGKVARTATRPIPAGEISVKMAVLFMVALALVGLLILLQFNWETVIVGIASLLLVAAYPFMKRITYWPQAWLGLTFNWGALVGWSSMQPGIAAPALVLYAAGFFWTLGYDTIYAHQDKEDDALIGVKSTALKFGDGTRKWLWGFYAIAILLIGTAGWLASAGWAFWPLLAIAAAHLVRQILTVKLNDPANCLAHFKSNRDFGLIILAAIVAGGITTG
jgi:4-hydroxybenzoate polyprenyltransferase